MTGRFSLALFLVISVLIHILVIGGADMLGSRGGGDEEDSFPVRYRQGDAADPPDREERSPEDDQTAGHSISLDAPDPAYRPYFKELRRAIGAQWEDPPRRQGEGGKVSLLIEFTLDSSGRLRSVGVVESSGIKQYDFAASRAVASAAPFEPFPPEIPRKELRIGARFLYE